MPRRWIVILTVTAMILAWGLLDGPAARQRRGAAGALRLQQRAAAALAADPRFAAVDVRRSSHPALYLAGEVPDEAALADLKRLFAPPDDAEFGVRFGVKVAVPATTRSMAETAPSAERQPWPARRREAGRRRPSGAPMPSDPRDYRVELSPAARQAAAAGGPTDGVSSDGVSSRPAAQAPGTPAAATDVAPADGSSAGAGRPFLSVHFACCGAYQRIYRSADGLAYVGRCPRCGKPVRFAVGAGGTNARSFTVR